MKKLLTVILSISMALMVLTSCKQALKPAASPTVAPTLIASQEPSPTAEPLVGIPNPIKEVDGAASLEQVGASIEAPEGAENARYFVIDSEPKLAEIQFTLDGVEYNYRAAVTSEDITGVYNEFNAPKELEVESDGLKTAITLKEAVTKDCRVAVWKWNEISYSLTTSGQIGAEAFEALAKTLATATVPAQ